MALETLPELATNLLYSILCLVPGFLTVETVHYLSDAEVDLTQFDKTTWSLIASGLSLSELYFGYVAWVAVTTSGVALVVPIAFQWTELVAAYPVLVVVADLTGAESMGVDGAPLCFRQPGPVAT